jgi:hypothetical protein
MASTCWGFPISEASAIDEIYTTAFIEAVAAGDWEAVDPFSCMASESTIRTSAIPHDSTAPVMMVIAEEDALTIAEPARDDVVALCDLGYEIQHMECVSTGHADAAVNTVLDQLAWAQARAAGEPMDPDNTCVVNEPIVCEDLLGR